MVQGSFCFKNLDLLLLQLCANIMASRARGVASG